MICMKKSIIKNTIIAAVAALSVTACSKKLDLFPQNDLTPEKTYSTAAGYKSVLAKVYGSLAITGNAGPAGSPDIGVALTRVRRWHSSAVSSIARNCQQMKPW